LDGDDLLPPNALAVVAKAIAEDPAARFMVGKFEAFGWYEDTVDPGSFQVQDILLRQPFNGCSPFHREVWDRVGGFDQVLSWGNQDWDFWIGVLSQGFRWVYVPEVIYLYRTRPGTLGQSYELRWPQISEYMYRKHAAFFDRHGARRSFLASGYHRAAMAAHQAGYFWAAARWASRAILLGDVSRCMVSVLGRNGVKAVLGKGRQLP
jgi:hypothetical protein